MLQTHYLAIFVLLYANFQIPLLSNWTVELYYTSVDLSLRVINIFTWLVVLWLMIAKNAGAISIEVPVVTFSTSCLSVGSESCKSLAHREWNLRLGERYFTRDPSCCLGINLTSKPYDSLWFSSKLLTNHTRSVLYEFRDCSESSRGEGRGGNIGRGHQNF